MNDVQHVVGFGGLERDDGVQRWDETIAGEGTRRKDIKSENSHKEHNFCSGIDCDWLPGVM